MRLPKGLTFFISFTAIGAVALSMAYPPNSAEIHFVSNSQLQTIHPDTSWRGTPIDQSGRFQNLYEPFESSLKDLLKWQLSPNPQKQEKKSDTRRISSITRKDLFLSEKEEIVWLGHASFLIRIGGKTLLIDPVFFESFFLKRYSDLPFDLEDIANIDYLLISHDHRDHCDEKTLKYLSEKLPKLTVLTGLEMGSLLSKWMPDASIQEAGWYQRYQLEEELEITFLPARHWSKRGLMDENERLWGGFFIKYGDRSVYFMGDSGYGRHFKEIAEILGSPDYAIMGVGAFKPEWFMSQAHISPMDALKAFEEMGGKHFIPMHFGTFDLSDEPLLEPLDILKSSGDNRLVEIEIGESLSLQFSEMDYSSKTIN